MTKYHLAGRERFATTNAPITKSFRIDAGVQVAGTATIVDFPKGATILSFVAIVTEAVSTGSSPTVQLGFTGTRMLSAAVAAATLVVGYPVGPNQTDEYETSPLVLTDNDTFDCIVATATLTTGKFDVHVTYLPPPDPCDSDDHEYVTA